MTEFVFAEPPPPLKGRGANADIYARFAAALRARPGEWAVWPTAVTASTTAGNVKQGRYAAFPLGQFEAVCREKKCYVRFIGAVTE